MPRDTMVDIGDVAGVGNVNVEETVEALRTQMAAVQAAIQGQSSSSFFCPKRFSGLTYEDVIKLLERFERYRKFYG